jgi:hypothetical protein
LKSNTVVAGSARTATQLKPNVMPVISKFYGIIVRLMKLSNKRTAIYANYGEHEVVLDAATLQIISGTAPARVVDMVCEWARQHHTELKNSFHAAITGRPMTIAPLQ